MNIDPYDSILSKKSWTKSGANGYKILEPSNGGIGIRLKIAKLKLISVNLYKITPISLLDRFNACATVKAPKPKTKLE